MKSLLTILVLAIFYSGCDATKALDSAANKMPDTMQSMNNKMDATVKGIDSTNEAVRAQKMKLAKDDMLLSENTRDLEPVAIGMIPGAKLFGEAATPTETVEFVKSLILQIKNEQTNDASLKEKYDHDKMIKFSMITAIAGWYPQDKLEQLIKEQITSKKGGGAYQKYALDFLMARVLFLSAYLGEDLLAQPIDTLGTMDEVINRVGYIDYVLKLSFKSKIKIDIIGFSQRDPIQVSLLDESGSFSDDSWNAPKLWKKVMKAFERDLKEGNIIEGSSIDTNEAKSQIVSMKTEVQSYIDSWNK